MAGENGEAERGDRQLTKQGALSPSTLAEPYLKAVTKRLEAAKAEKAAA